MKRILSAFLLFVAAVASADPNTDKVAKTWDLLPLESAAGAQLPDAPADRWGTWIFWNGQWWAQHLLQPEAQYVSWTAPKAGFDAGGWQKYHAAWIRAKRSIPAEWRGQRVLLTQDGIRMQALTLYVNRKEVGRLKPPMDEIDVSAFLEYGAENEFLMLLDGGNTSNFKFEKNPPMLVPKAAVSVDHVFANTSWRKKTLTVEADVTVPQACKGTLHAIVLDADGKGVKKFSKTFDLQPGENAIAMPEPWANPIPWELGCGYLYRLKTCLVVGQKQYDGEDVRFGFREVWREGRKIFFNGHEQKFRVCYSYACDGLGAKFLTRMGYNTIQFAHVVADDPTQDEKMLEYLSENGIAAILPTTGFNFNSKGPLMKPGEKREAFKAMQAKNLRRYRNWPCVVMQYMGVNAYLPTWAYEAVHLGSGDNGEFAKMMDDLVESAKKTNPNVLYYSHSDGNTGEIASANLYFNWIPMQEREDWPSRWAQRGHFPFQAAEFGHPYILSWFRNGRDCITELCAIYYGDKAYETEPERIATRHKPGIWQGYVQHPMTRKLQEDFAWRVTRAWRTFGINAGIVWFNLDQGYGTPGWTMEKLWDGYPEPHYNFFKSEEEVMAKHDWDLPYMDYYRKGNEDFLGWIAGWPRITDRRHAYYSGETVRKQNVMMWDLFDTRAFSTRWKATDADGNVIAKGECKGDLVSNVPRLDPISFKAPDVTKKTRYRLSAAYFNDTGLKIAEDSLAFEVYPRKTEEVRTRLEAEAKSSPKVRVVPPYSLKSAKDIPLEEVRAGLRLLVLPQSVKVMREFGFDVDDAAPRQLFLRDTVSKAFSTLGEGDLREWWGQPLTDQQNKFDFEPYGRMDGKGDRGPRWNYNMALGGLVVRTPDVVGYLPVVEGEFDGNYCGVLRRFVGKGEILFSTLSTSDRFATNELEGKPVRDPAADMTECAIYSDLLRGEEKAHERTVVADGEYARRLAREVGAVLSADRNAAAANILLAGPDSTLSPSEVQQAANAGANVLIMGNKALAEGLGLRVESDETAVYRVEHGRKNPALRAIGTNLFHFRDEFRYSKLFLPNGGAKSAWTIDAEGMFASRTLPNGARIFVTQYETFQLEDRIRTEPECLRFGKLTQVDDKLRKTNLRNCDISFERSRQFAARLLTTLGCAAEPTDKLYRGLVEPLDAYYYHYW